MNERRYDDINEYIKTYNIYIYRYRYTLNMWTPMAYVFWRCVAVSICVYAPSLAL